MMSDHAAIIEKAHAMAAAVAPELAADAPLYVLDGAQVEAVGMPMNGCHGQAWWLLIPPQLVDAIGPAWRGPGPTVLLALDAIEAAARPGYFEQCALSVVCHEFAQALPSRPVRRDSEERRARYAELFALDRTTPERPPLPEVDPQHDLRFIRRYMHLISRAKAAGWPVHPHDGWATFSLTGMCAESYLSVLEPEALELKDRTFAEIEATPPPPELLALWQEDLAYIRHLRGGD
jgi:hypothetical protein